eukprot:scpid51554/ scgid10173/ 
MSWEFVKKIDERLLSYMEQLSKKLSEDAERIMKYRRAPIQGDELTAQTKHNATCHHGYDISEGDLWRNTFLPAVCCGDVAKIRESLFDLAVEDTGEQLDKATCDDEEKLAALISRSERTKKCRDQCCGESSYGALHYAVLGRQVESVRTLLALGADPNIYSMGGTTCMVQYWGVLLEATQHCMTPLWFAAALGEVEIARILAEAGAHVMSCTVLGFNSLYLEESPWRAARGDQKMLEAIHCAGKNPVPILEAIFAVLFGPKSDDGDLHFCWQPGVVRWLDNCLSVRRLFTTMLEQVAARQFLSLPCITFEEHVCKAVVLQTMLVLIALDDNVSPTQTAPAGELALSVIRAGGHAIGWDFVQLSVLHKLITRICKEGTAEKRKIYPKHYNTLAKPVLAIDRQLFTQPSPSICPEAIAHSKLFQDDKTRAKGDGVVSQLSPFHLLPVVLRYCAVDGDEEDEIAKLLLEEGNVPWLKSLSHIPWVDGHLHDGTVCDHVVMSAEQRSVSLQMLTSSGCGAATLSSLCRQSVYSQLSSADELESMVDNLPLPDLLKNYIMS